MDIVSRLREFTAKDFICSYFAKFCIGLGLGLLFPEKWGVLGWPFILLAVIVGFQPELKFWKSHK